MLEDIIQTPIFFQITIFGFQTAIFWFEIETVGVFYEQYDYLIGYGAKTEQISRTNRQQHLFLIVNDV